MALHGNARGKRRSTVLRLHIKCYCAIGDDPASKWDGRSGDPFVFVSELCFLVSTQSGGHSTEIAM